MIFEWTEIGRHAYGQVEDGRIVTLLYWTEADVGELDGPGGDPIVTDAGWYLVATNDPDNHLFLSDAPLEDVDAAMDAAADVFVAGKEVK